MAITYSSVADPRWEDETRRTVQVYVKFDHIPQVIPFRASSNDPEDHGRDIYARAVAGEFGSIAPAHPPLPPTQEEYQFAAQKHVDDVAKARGYADGVTCSSYANSTAPSWKAEADAFVAWRDSFWSYALALLADVMAGHQQAPSIATFIGAAPVITWPAS